MRNPRHLNEVYKSSLSFIKEASAFECHVTAHLCTERLPVLTGESALIKLKVVISL
jgi:hypothetical protein